MGSELTPNLDLTSQILCQLKVVLRSLSSAVVLFRKDDGKFVQLAVTGPCIINFRVINHN